jgi:hypothetical protein
MSFDLDSQRGTENNCRKIGTEKDPSKDRSDAASGRKTSLVIRDKKSEYEKTLVSPKHRRLHRRGGRGRRQRRLYHRSWLIMQAMVATFNGFNNVGARSCRMQKADINRKNNPSLVPRHIGRPLRPAVTFPLRNNGQVTRWRTFIVGAANENAAP